MPPMCFRPYEPEKDKDAVHRIWREIGWIERGQEPRMDLFLQGGQTLVAEVEGAAECLVATAPGTVRYLAEDLPMSCVTAVTTSRIARRQGIAGRLTARAIADAAADGAIVSALGMFEQGFYDRLGFGTGGYEHLVALDPSQLRFPRPGRSRVPRRITTDDWEAVHANRLNRFRGHGACNLTEPVLTRAEMLQTKNGFGLGFADESGGGGGGGLSHHLWCSAKDDVEFGPYRVKWLAWQTPEQFLELMGLLKNLGDQVYLIHLREPAGIQLQDLLNKPFTQWSISERSKYEAEVKAIAYWQMRICDLGKCLERTHLRGDEVRFNLRMTDPIEKFLPADSPWPGVAGEYVVTLGPTCGAEPGFDQSLPTLEAPVSTFTRLWLGIRPATGLAITDDLVGPRDLLEELDHLLRLPEPKPDWDF